MLLQNIKNRLFVANLSKTHKNTEQAKTKEHKESNIFEKYDFLINAVYQSYFFTFYFLTNFEEVITKNQFSSFSTF